MTVQGQQLDFDITAPEDLQRYTEAMERMRTQTEGLRPPDADLSTSEGMRAYTDFMKTQCRILTDFIDGAFGDGTCNRLLGQKTSVAKLNALCEDIGAALVQQGEQNAKVLAAYTPNRRRAAMGGDAHELGAL